MHNEVSSTNPGKSIALAKFKLRIYSNCPIEIYKDKELQQAIQE